MGAARLTIDLDAIAANWQRLARMSASETGATVKADAYGLGAPQVAKRLARAGARTFFVALAEEGAAIRQALGAGPRIFVFSGHMPGDTQGIRNLDLIPVLNSPDQLVRHFESLPGHPFGVQLDTGMNRLGMEHREWQAVREMVLEAGPALIMSHLACSDEPDHLMNAQQLEEFTSMTEGCNVPRSLAATGGILLGPSWHFDLTRPGIGLYAAQPFEAGQPAVRLELPVIQERIVEPGEIVGYSGTWLASHPTRVLTVAAGYADGILRSLSGKATLWAGDIPCPVIGRVSMDLITVDGSALPGAAPEALDLICERQRVDDLAAIAGTIGYEILTSLGNRYRRRYLGAGS